MLANVQTPKDIEREQAVLALVLSWALEAVAEDAVTVQEKETTRHDETHPKLLGGDRMGFGTGEEHNGDLTNTAYQQNT